MESLAAWVWSLLGWGVYPLWLASGVLDYACHRYDRIEARSGVTEPLLHLAQALQVGAAALLVLLFALTPAVLLVVGVAVVLHSITAYLDIAWAASRRPIRPVEQFGHTLLVGLPLVAFVLLLVIAWTGTEGGEGEALFPLRRPPLPLPVIAAVVISGGVVAVIPALAEWLRARRFAPAAAR
jgi:hypothetical protein